jgi:ATP-dependent helicase HepA
MNSAFHPGQRWISDSEPELGLGSVLRLTDRTVTVVFPASGETRQYASDNAPLRRVRFRVGDSIKDHDGQALVVQAVSERAGLIHYRVGGRELCETHLSDAISFNKPEERLLAGQMDPTEVFDLRLAALQQQHRRRQSPVRGFVGGRIDLIPHQLHIAAEVSGRLEPRVLLADEVGLGKTIEACLILHRLILTGRAQRVLILLPDSLVHQWFVELLRRFNLWFHIFDEERCAAIEATDPEANPFLDDQLVLASLRLFSGSERRLQQALDAGWDMLVVDEAHHLGWSPENVSRDYAVVEALGRRSPGLLLLTATPEQLGMASHFARLRLLDPARFHDLGEFVLEAESYRDVARLADKLINRQALDAEERRILGSILGLGEISAAAVISDRDELIDSLLDRHGTGRVMFRNTRSTITGFPRRIARLHALPAPTVPPGLIDALAEEFTADTDDGATEFFEPDFDKDPRVDWLVDLLRGLGEEKVLLICRTQAKVEELDASLRRRINVKMAAFHEGLTLVQRDRHAAWFAEKDGARILLCSEIGSEGRNFQFAHHLVLFDLPLDPELLEQRIGRLDRIGQTSEIQVHVPFVAGSAQEVLSRWFHQGLNSFEKNLHGGRELLERFGSRVHDLALESHGGGKASVAALSALITETVAARRELTERLEQGRDRLLELNSFRPESAARLVQEISKRDADTTLESFMVDVFDHFAIHVEELTHRTYQLGSAGVFAESFPGLPAGGMTLTGDRQKALSREDVQFLTWDHPLVTGALDLLLGSEKGNSSFAKWPDAKGVGLYVETVHVLECIAPSPLHVDRFLPPTPLRVMVDHRGNDAGTALPSETLKKHLKNGEGHALFDQAEFREDLLPVLLQKAEALAGRQAPALIAEARKTMAAQLDHEIARLAELQKVNQSVRPEELTLLASQKTAIDQHLAGARLRLDAIRVIQRGPQ